MFRQTKYLLLTLISLSSFLFSISAKEKNSDVLWSIYDPDYPVAHPIEVHPIMTYGMSMGDSILNRAPRVIQETAWYFLTPGTAPCPTQDLLCGNFYDLKDKGLLRFLLDMEASPRASNNPPWHEFRMGPVPMLLPDDLNVVLQILNHKSVYRGLAYNGLVDFFGYGIFTSRNQTRWRDQRTTMLRLFTASSLNAMAESMYEGLLEEVNKAADSKKPVDLVLLLSRMGLFAFCDSILGVDVRDIADELAPAINVVLAEINGTLEPIRVPYGDRYNKFIHNRDIVHNWMTEVVERIKEQAPEERKKNPFIDRIVNEEKPMNPDELVELMISTVLGGHETTARLMLGSIYNLMKHPAYMNLVRGEVDEYFKNHPEERSMKMQSHEELPLLVQTIFESLRLYPPVWVLARTPSEDITVTQEKEGKSYSWLIHQGTEIFISPLILQRQKSVWGEDAEVFKPERMKLAKGFFRLDSEIEKIFYPFVDGAYKCPGREFAKLESMLAIAGLLHNFDIKLENQDQLPDPISGGTFRLFSKLSVKITPRPHMR